MSTNSASWYIPGEGKQPAGPFTAEQVVERWQEGRLRADAVCWREGMLQWLPLSQVEPFATAMRSASPSKHPAPLAIPTTLPALAAAWDRCLARVRNAAAADKRIVPLAAGIAVAVILLFAVWFLAFTGGIPVSGSKGARSLTAIDKEAARRTIDYCKPTMVGGSCYIDQSGHARLNNLNGTSEDLEGRTLVELRDARIVVNPESLSEVDRLNEVTWRGTVVIECSAARSCALEPTQGKDRQNHPEYRKWSEWSRDDRYFYLRQKKGEWIVTDRPTYIRDSDMGWINPMGHGYSYIAYRKVVPADIPK